MTLHEANFEENYNASVIALRRGEERLSGKLSDIRLRVGDLLHIAADVQFPARDAIQSTLHLVHSPAPIHRDLGSSQSSLVLGCFAAFACLVLGGVIDLAQGAVLLVVGALGLSWLAPNEVRRRFPFGLAIVLWGSVILGTLIQRSGFASWIADWFIQHAGTEHQLFALAAVLGLTWLLTELLSNVSAALAALPVALDVAHRVDAQIEAFALAAAFGASASFLMPFGYQTHLMIYTPGRYRMAHFLGLGSVALFSYLTATLTALWFIWLR